MRAFLFGVERERGPVWFAKYRRGRKPWTLRGYRSMIHVHPLPAFGKLPGEDLTPQQVERWIATVPGCPFR